MRRVITLSAFVLGVVFQQIAGGYIQAAWDQGHDVWCGGSANLARGKVALAEAVQKNKPERYDEALAALEKARLCGVSGEASFLLALQHCNGLGVAKNPARGRQLLREAISREPHWGIEILANPELCKIAD